MAGVLLPSHCARIWSITWRHAPWVNARHHLECTFCSFWVWELSETDLVLELLSFATMMQCCLLPIDEGVFQFSDDETWKGEGCIWIPQCVVSLTEASGLYFCIIYLKLGYWFLASWSWPTLEQSVHTHWAKVIQMNSGWAVAKPFKLNAAVFNFKYITLISYDSSSVTIW